MGIVKLDTKEKGGIIVESILHDSTNVLKTSYNFTTKQLVVTFIRGGVYNYNNVSHELYEALKIAPSVGSFINSELKSTHTVVKIGDAPAETLNLIKEEIQVNKNNLI